MSASFPAEVGRETGKRIVLLVFR